MILLSIFGVLHHYGSVGAYVYTLRMEEDFLFPYGRFYNSDESIPDWFFILIHLPIYVNPSLLDPVSEPLRKRMQGKSCFNFRSLEADLFSELKELTEAGYRSYVEQGYIQRDV